MATASSQVLHTVELLDLILSHLALRDLLAAQRVNYLWHSIVRTSKVTQRSKFLLADTALSIPKDGYSLTNPLYLQRFVQQACFYAMQQMNTSVQLLGLDHFVQQKIKSFADEQANWRDMLLFQPPVKAALFKSMSAHYEDGYYYLRNPEGLRMGDVVEFFKGKAGEGKEAVRMLTATATRKIVWSLLPAATLGEEYEHLF